MKPPILEMKLEEEKESWVFYMLEVCMYSYVYVIRQLRL